MHRLRAPLVSDRRIREPACIYCAPRTMVSQEPPRTVRFSRVLIHRRV